jgi:hypothetical protein
MPGCSHFANGADAKPTTQRQPAAGGLLNLQLLKKSAACRHILEPADTKPTAARILRDLRRGSADAVPTLPPIRGRIQPTEQR